MKNPSFEILDMQGRMHSLPIPSGDSILKIRRKNTGIDFSANKEARETLSPDAYLFCPQEGFGA